MKIDVIDERYPLWVMDSECCCRCGALLDYFETDMCADCWEDQWYNEEQEYYDGWGSDWDIPIEEVGKP